MNVVTVCAALFLMVSGADAAFALLADDNSADIEALAQRLDQLEEKVNTPQIRPNLFNPGLTAFGNFLTCVGCEDIFVFREVELDIRASIDPWADGVFILAFEPPHSHDDDHGHGHAHGFNVDIEEAYVTLKKLPVLNTTPLGMTLKAGRFRIPFGRMNQIHLHDWPMSTLPQSMQAMLGEHGVSRTGFSGQFLIPTPGDSNALMGTLQILSGGGVELMKIPEPKYPGFLGRLAWFWDLAPNNDLEWGVTGYVEPKPTGGVPVQMYGTDLSYKWRPYVLGEKRSILVSSELYVMPYNNLKLGTFTWAQYQFNQWLYLGVRYDYRHVEKSVNNEQNIGHAVGTFLTYYTTEFLRLRAGYEMVTDAGWSNIRNNFLFEVNFIIGSHPVEPYWVNR